MNRRLRTPRRRAEPSSFAWFSALVMGAFFTVCVARLGPVWRDGLALESEHAPVGPRTTAAPARRPAPRFAHVARSEALEVSADVAQPVEELRAFCETTLATLRGAWGTGAPLVRPPRYRVYLCGELETMYRLEEQNGWPRSDREPGRTFDYRGGFYADVHMVLLRAEADEDMRGDLAHELVHAVFAEVVGKDCDALNEGLAQYASQRLLGREPGPFRLEASARALVEGDTFSLAEFFALDYWQFRDARLEGRGFALSELLVRVLLEDSSFAARFPRLLANLRAQEPWLALRRTYDVVELEAAWQRRIEEATRWVPVFGEWSQTQDARTVTLWEAGTVMLVEREARRYGEGFTLRVRLASRFDPRGELGFVLGFQDEHAYQVLILRPRVGGLVVATCRDDHWGPSTFTPVAGLPLDWTVAELSLECSPVGVVTLRYGARELARRKLGAEAFRGRAGLYLEPRAVDPDGGRRVAFEYVDACPAADVTGAPR